MQRLRPQILARLKMYFGKSVTAKDLERCEDPVPTISMFYGIIISIYWKKAGKRHSPHFHARCGNVLSLASTYYMLMKKDYPDVTLKEIKDYINATWDSI